MPIPHPARALALCLLAAPLAAQPLPDALQAASPHLSGLPPRPLVLPAPVPAPTEPADLDAARAQWQQSNRDVGAFPRGHADLLRWEASRSTGTDAAPPPARAPALTAHEALQRSLSNRPDLVLAPDANALETSTRQQALAQHTLEVRHAWLASVAAREALDHEQALAHAAGSAAELGRRMVQAGNWSQARLLREQLTQAQQQAAVWQAEAEVSRTTEALLQRMGVWRPDEVQAVFDRLPRTLPALPARPEPPANVDTTALRARPDLDNRVADTRLATQRLNATSRRQWDAALDTALQALPSDGTPQHALRLADPRPQREHGLQAALEQEARLLREAARLRSQAREAWQDLARQHALAEHAQKVLLPLQTALEQETLLRYNGMLQSTWDLIDASKARMRAAADASRARHAFWQARLNWDALQAGLEPLAAPAAASTPNAPTGTAAAH